MPNKEYETYFESLSEWCPENYSDYINKLKLIGEDAANYLKCSFNDLECEIRKDYRGCYYESDKPTIKIIFRKKII